MPRRAVQWGIVQEGIPSTFFGVAGAESIMRLPQSTNNLVEQFLFFLWPGNMNSEQTLSLGFSAFGTQNHLT